MLIISTYPQYHQFTRDQGACKGAEYRKPNNKLMHGKYLAKHFFLKTETYRCTKYSKLMHLNLANKIFQFCRYIVTVYVGFTRRRPGRTESISISCRFAKCRPSTRYRRRVFPFHFRLYSATNKCLETRLHSQRAQK